MLRGAVLATLAGVVAVLSVQAVDAQVVDETACPYYAVDIADFYTCEPKAPADGTPADEWARESAATRVLDVGASDAAWRQELAAVPVARSNAGTED